MQGWKQLFSAAGHVFAKHLDIHHLAIFTQDTSISIHDGINGLQCIIVQRIIVGHFVSQVLRTKLPHVLEKIADGSISLREFTCNLLQYSSRVLTKMQQDAWGCRNPFLGHLSYVKPKR